MEEITIQFEKIKRTTIPTFGTKEGNEYYDNIIDKISDPQIKKLSQIRYTVPGNYTNPRCFLRFIARYLDEKARGAEYNDEEIHLLSNLLICDLIEHNIPFYVITKDIFTALLNTTPPEEGWDLRENPLPFPATGFIFPHNTLILDNNKNVTIDWAVLGKFKFPEGHHRLIALSNDNTNNCFLLSTVREEHALSAQVPVYNEKRGTERELTSMESVNNVMKALYNIVTLMNTCPEYVENKTESKEVPAKRRGEANKVFSTCKTIGKNFRIIKSHETSSDGSGRNVRMHWRRGHWHHTVKGSRAIPLEERRKLFVKKWFQPVLVNA